MSTETIPDSPEFKINLNRLALPLAVISAIVALAGAWLLLPYRLEAVEKRTTVVEQKLDAQQQLLIRIDENVKVLKEKK